VLQRVAAINIVRVNVKHLEAGCMWLQWLQCLHVNFEGRVSPTRLAVH
jgi:hypothetical protein